MTGSITTRNLFVAWGVFTLLVAVFAAYDATRERPTDGSVWRLGREEIRLVGVEPDGPADRAGLRVGDVIEGIDRQAIRDPRHASRLLQSREAGDEVPYLVRRDGEVTTVVVELASTRLESVAVYLVYCGLGIIYFVAGAYVFWRNSTQLPARLFYVLCTLFLVYFFSATERSSIYYWADAFVQNAGTFASLMVPPLFLHFFLVFPMRRSVLDRQPWSIWAIYLIPSLYYVSYSYEQFVERQTGSIGALEQMTLGLYFAAGLASLVSIFVSSRDTTLRQRVKFLTLGTVLGTLPFLVFNIALGQLLGREDFALLGAIPMVLVPVSFGYTIARYRLMDIEVLIRRSVVYVILTTLVIGVYVVLVVLVGNVVLDVSGQNSQLVAILATLLIAAAFAPARERIQGFLERRFFREKHDLQQALHDLAKAIPNTLETPTLLLLVRERLSGLLHPTAFEFLECDDDDVLTHTNGGERIELPRFTHLIRRRSAPLTPEVLAGEVSRLARGDDPERRAQREELDREIAYARDAGLEILIPAFAGDRLVGGLALGPKRSEMAYDGAELEILQIVAGQMGVQVENTRLYREAIERQRLEEELAVARSIQQRLLPAGVPSFEGFDLAAVNQASAQVSGDYFDFLKFGDRCGMVIADVSGKGLPASLLASNLQASIRALASYAHTPDTIFEAVNTTLYESTDPERFATAFLSILDAQGRLTYSNAGHNPPLLRRSDGRVEWLDVGATPLGAFPDMAYASATVELEPGDVLVLYTDGVTEAEGDEGDLFGESGLATVIEQCTGSDADTVVRCIREAVRKHANGVAADDMTLIVVRRVGSDAVVTGETAAGSGA